MAMCNWPHAIWKFYRSRIICSTQPTTVPWHSLAVCVCALHVLLMCAFAVFVQIFYVTAKGLRWNPWKQTNYFGNPVQNTTSYLAPKWPWWFTTLHLLNMICPDFFCCMIIFYLRLDHLVYDVAPQTNPIKLSCYMDEDAVGKLKKLAMASSPQNMGECVLSRYASYICVRWLRRMEW